MSKPKARIVERYHPTIGKSWTIQTLQRPYWPFWWGQRWQDAWLGSGLGAMCQDTFYSLEEAEKMLPLFDGTPVRETVVKESP